MTQDATHRFVTDTEKSTWNGKAEGNHNHDSTYQPKGSYAAASHSHSASDITEVTNKKFMTDAEKSVLSSLGTTYALKDFSNIGVKSLGQNGYRKYDDGLLIVTNCMPFPDTALFNSFTILLNSFPCLVFTAIQPCISNSFAIR